MAHYPPHGWRRTPRGATFKASGSLASFRSPYKRCFWGSARCLHYVVQYNLRDLRTT